MYILTHDSPQGFRRCGSDLDGGGQLSLGRDLPLLTQPDLYHTYETIHSALGTVHQQCDPAQAMCEIYSSNLRGIDNSDKRVVATDLRGMCIHGIKKISDMFADLCTRTIQ